MLVGTVTPLQSAARQQMQGAQTSRDDHDRVLIGHREPSLGLMPKPFGANAIVTTKPLARSGQTECTTWGETLKVLDGYAASVLVTGFGSKCQYADPAAVQQQLGNLAKDYDQQYGKGNWIAIFGGDPYTQDKPDVAHMTRFLQQNHGTPVMAIQSDVVKGWGGVDKELDYVHYVPTAYEKKTQPDGSTKDAVIWGGFRDGKPQGPTAGYLGSDLVSGENPRLKAMMVIGGGDISAQEASYAKQQGVKVHYIKAEAKFPEPGKPFGSVDQVLG